ncbi:TnsA endonuclease N-terminal domain-containing protein [Shewanella sp. Isolate13]|uniref:TnsA endonuclease N-terminal domain-containing protein n=1 Tax=Shewanella sp. Isolate13 TaxID=2908531 RepID=UPI001EFCE2CE|nr:TnsA endonuclease N-terminal domain-containing protein [Shewanella sp. Isolate13]MCG9731111.1 TnsA endonuclease N-terminal domain-containing protein [Shewanella sp. Isolate13]
MSDANKPLNKKDQKRLDEKRGEGTGKDYIPFIRVGEFSSSGESVRVKSATVGRVHHFHSGNELAAFLLFDWYKEVIDIREQFPIPLIDSLIICRQLGIRHPQEKGELKIVTTDLLIDFADGSQLAIPVKPALELDKKRIREKLQIEKAYWEDEKVTCLIFTDQEVSNELKMNLKWIRPLIDIDIKAEYPFSKQDVIDLAARLARQPKAFVARHCAKLDDEYQLDEGTHIGVFRYGIANQYLKASLEIPFTDWKCEDIELLMNDSLEFGVGNAF